MSVPVTQGRLPVPGRSAGGRTGSGHVHTRRAGQSALPAHGSPRPSLSPQSRANPNRDRSDPRSSSVAATAAAPAVTVS